MGSPEVQGSKLIPTLEQLIASSRPTSVSEFLNVFHSPIAKIGLALHTEFSGLNLRGAITHDVVVRRGEELNYKYLLANNVSRDQQVLIACGLQFDEIEAIGQALHMFLNELNLTAQDISEGFIRLERVQEDIPESNCPFSVGIMLTPEAITQGKSGFIVSSYGEIDLLPEVKDNLGKIQFKSGLEEKNYKLFVNLRNVSVGEIKHPLVERLIVETAYLIGNAVIKKQIKKQINSGVF